ncbi:MAG: DUF4469 domain-containing protein [Tannerella sp.]|jgi:hypothetical protein|nr:DUF4469 domain-containing protein [Tannerella sp.]
MKKFFKVLVQLYRLPITSHGSDRSGRVLLAGSKKIDDLIALAVKRHTDLNPATLKASYEILKALAMEEVCNAKQVEFGLSHYRLGVNGVFHGDRAGWDRDRHSLDLQAIATAEMRRALRQIPVEVHGMAATGTCINTLTDLVSGEVNTRITPGGIVNLAGVRMKIAGTAKDVGLRLTALATGAVTQIPLTSIARNNPSKITFLIPPGLPSGDYRLSIVTQYSSTARLLKQPQTCVLAYVLACG